MKKVWFFTTIISKLNGGIDYLEFYSKQEFIDSIDGYDYVAQTHLSGKDDISEDGVRVEELVFDGSKIRHSDLEKLLKEKLISFA